MIHVWGPIDILGAWWLDGQDSKHYVEIRHQIVAITNEWA